MFKELFYNKGMIYSLVIIVAVSLIARMAVHADGPSKQDYKWLEAIKQNQQIITKNRTAYDRVTNATTNSYPFDPNDVDAYNAFVKAKADNAYKVAALNKDGWQVKWDTLTLIPFHKEELHAAASINLASFTEDTRLTDDQLHTVLRKAGFTGRSLEVAFAVARAESGGRPYAFNGRGADKSYGILQINMRGRLGKARLERFGLQTYEDLYKPEINAKIAYAISDGGKNWSSWGAYSNGSYRKYL